MSSSLSSLNENPGPFQIHFDSDHTSPTRATTSSAEQERGRAPLTQLSPEAIIERSRPPSKPRPTDRPGDLRSKPKLSPDKIGRYFTIESAAGREWSPHDVRFVIWYHVRTTLPFISIAIAHNSTYPENDIKMTDKDAERIYEVIADLWPDIKEDLHPGGHYPIPDADGWHPCDLGMCCSTLAERDRSQVSVVFKPKTRTKGVRVFREMATGIWEGSWEELLRCPRNHDLVSEDASQSDVFGAENLLSGEPDETQATGDANNIDSADCPLAKPPDVPVSFMSTSSPQVVVPPLVALIGGPKALFLLIETSCRFMVLLALWANFFGPLYQRDKNGNEPIKISNFVKTLIQLLALTGAYSWLDWFLQHFMKDQMRIFEGIDLPPPLSSGYCAINFLLGIATAVAVGIWNEWCSPRESIEVWILSWRRATNAEQ